MQKYFSFFIFHFLLILSVSAQELDCTVKVNYDQLNSQQRTETQVFAEIENAIKDFMNTQRWTNDQFAQHEKIKCSLNINFLRSPSQNIYSGTAQFVVQRPVYNSEYETSTLNYIDKTFAVSFQPADRQMLFNENTYSSNLTSTLAFYALVAVGLDYDSFSKLGGTAYLQRAFNIATLASNAGQAGWGANDDQRNRYWLAENLMNQQFRAFREGMYNYHRLGLDKTTEEPQMSRKYANEILNTAQQIRNMQTTSVLLTTFFEAKNRELFSIFSEAPTDEKQRIFTLLTNLDPSRTEMYRDLVK